MQISINTVGVANPEQVRLNFSAKYPDGANA